MMQAVDYVFTQMAAAYGAAWDKSLGAAPLTDIKSRWLYELDPFRHSKKRIVWALAHLPKFAPNAMECAQLCRQAPAPELMALPEPAANPERAAVELARLAPLFQRHATAAPDNPKAWAHQIMRRHENGEKVNAFPLRCARRSLGLSEPEPGYRSRAEVTPQAMTPAEAYYAGKKAA